jgi:hypothetical protein
MVAVTDNASDPDVMATKFYIDIIKGDDDKLRMICQDNGYGASPSDLHRMLSFGYCDKVCVLLAFDSISSGIDWGGSADHRFMPLATRLLLEIESPLVRMAMVSNQARCAWVKMRWCSQRRASSAVWAFCHKPI